MHEQLAQQGSSRSKELTPVQRFLMRELRVRGNTHARIAKLMKVSLQTVQAQTTALDIKPATSEIERSLQLDLIRKRFALESGLDLDGEFGEELWRVFHIFLTRLADSIAI
jgi:hypothetical protein